MKKTNTLKHLNVIRLVGIVQGVPTVNRETREVQFTVRVPALTGGGQTHQLKVVARGLEAAIILSDGRTGCVVRLSGRFIKEVVSGVAILAENIELMPYDGVNTEEYGTEVHLFGVMPSVHDGWIDFEAHNSFKLAVNDVNEAGQRIENQVRVQVTDEQRSYLNEHARNGFYSLALAGSALVIKHGKFGEDEIAVQVEKIVFLHDGKDTLTPRANEEVFGFLNLMNEEENS